MRLAIALILGAACGGDNVDLTGMYRVDSAIGSEPCGTDTSITFAAFVKFTKMSLLGQAFFAYDGCTDDAGLDCTTIGGAVGGFFEPQSDGWGGRSSFSSGGGTDGGTAPCSLGIGRQTATLHGTALEIEVSGYEDTVPDQTQAQCTPDAAEQRGTAMPCVKHSLVDATKL